MSDWPSPLWLPAGTNHLTSFGPNALGPGLAINGGWGSAAYPSANLILYVPFRLEQPTLIRKVFWANGATVSGNVDCGVYDRTGVKLFASGSTAQSGVSVVQAVDITDYQLGSGQFFMALTLDGTTGTLLRNLNTSTVSILRCVGMLEEAAVAFGLPATATFAVMATAAYVPAFGLVIEVGGV